MRCGRAVRPLTGVLVAELGRCRRGVLEAERTRRFGVWLLVRKGDSRRSSESSRNDLWLVSSGAGRCEEPGGSSIRESALHRGFGGSSIDGVLAKLWLGIAACSPCSYTNTQTGPW